MIPDGAIVRIRSNCYESAKDWWTGFPVPSKRVLRGPFRYEASVSFGDRRGWIESLDGGFRSSVDPKYLEQLTRHQTDKR